ncbi:hypothetical protein Cgig2_025171 [Carnegiea gigantea]|uniref:Uncharacterized protein n=1 Tax=Carnegiea gigantea TaxID=171969 RepID=A0A9Q1KTA7_9CARY|nr:hypothetical protein Cgig2_025171 [Carnegiea gigantea]
MGIIERIKEIEAEMARTQKNKATEYHLGQLKAKIAKLRTQLLEPPKGSSGGGEGFEVTKFGHGRVALIGFPSVGKSTLLTTLTGTHSEAASYEFTTLTCIPGIIHYNDTKIQLLDLPGIIEGASEGKGRGRQVIAVAKSSDLILMVLDASKSEGHRQILTRELEAVGLRLNKRPPQIYFKKKKTGGISFNSTLPLTHVDEKLCYQILHEYKIHNAEVLFREDATVDDLIDVIEGNRKYIKCLYVYNKIDVVGIDDVDRLARQPNSIVISANLRLNLDRLLAKMWEEMGLVRVYTKPQGQQPDFSEPVVLSLDRGGCTVEDFCNHIHRTLVKDLKYALVWGTSARHYPQHCGLSHVLQDEDVVQIVKKKVGKGGRWQRSIQVTYNSSRENIRQRKEGTPEDLDEWMDSFVIPVHIEEKTCAYLLRSMASSDVPFGLSAWIAHFCPMQSGIGLRLETGLQGRFPAREGAGGGSTGSGYSGPPATGGQWCGGGRPEVLVKGWWSMVVVDESGGAKSRLVCPTGERWPVAVASSGWWQWRGGGRLEVPTEGWWPPLLGGGVNYWQQAIRTF